MSEQSEITVLVVEDNIGLANLYTLWLDEFYAVKTVGSGEEALEQVDKNTDVVLLDRRMPSLSGGEVLTEIREQGLDCQVVMVTAISPAFDIIEMGFDDYLTKPIEREELHGAVERQLQLRKYSESLQEYFSLAVKITALQTHLTDEELDKNEQYTQLESRFGQIKGEARSQLNELFESGDGTDVIRMISRE